MAPRVSRGHRSRHGFYMAMAVTKCHCEDCASSTTMSSSTLAASDRPWEQIDLEKPCRSPQRIPRSLDSGAKIGLATCLGTLLAIWPQQGGGFEPTTAKNQEPRLRPFGPAGSFPWGIVPLGNRPPGESSPCGIVPLGNLPPGESPPWGINSLVNHPPGESSPWGIVPLGNRTPRESSP